MQHIEIDRTDEEREELVKAWINDYWLLVVGVVVVAIGVVYGLSYFRQAKLDALSETATRTDSVVTLIKAGRIAEAEKVTATLQADDSTSSFATVATLTLAKKLFDDKKYDEATVQYTWLIDNAGDPAMRDIARLRKARAQSNADKNTQAIDTLAGLEGKDGILEATLLKGDILMATDQFEQAQQAYEVIQSNSEINPQIVKQRLDLLKIKRQKSESVEAQESERQAVAQPEVTQPEVTQPEVAPPEVTQPAVAQPEVTQPEVAPPKVTQPAVVPSEPTVQETIEN